MPSQGSASTAWIKCLALSCGNLQVFVVGTGSPGNLEQTLDFPRRGIGERANRPPLFPGMSSGPELQNNWRWDFCRGDLVSPPPFLSLFRAWLSSDKPQVRQLVLDWLTSPGNYKGRRKDILPDSGRRAAAVFFGTLARNGKFYMEESLVFHPSSYRKLLERS